MTIINGWVDWAVRENVRQDKQYADPNQGLGMAWHSQPTHAPDDSGNL